MAPALFKHEIIQLYAESITINILFAVLVDIIKINQ